MSTFEISSILLNTTIGVLIVGYGIWLRNIFKHQIEAKDAIIAAKDAEITRLRADMASAIVEAYAKMRAHADQMTVDVNLFNQTLDKHTKILPQVRLSVEVQLLARVAQRMLDLIGSGEPARQVVNQVIRELLAEADKKISELPDR